MLYPPVADLLKNVGSRYLLVNVVAQRARQLADEAEMLNEELPLTVSATWRRLSKFSFRCCSMS